MKTDPVKEMENFLRERYGITNHAQLKARIREMQKINLAIFNEVKAVDDSRSKAAG